MAVTTRYRWKYTQTFVMDGNFSAEHLKMKLPLEDIALADGHGFMVTDKPYKQHVATAADRREVRTYSIFVGLF